MNIQKILKSLGIGAAAMVPPDLSPAEMKKFKEEWDKHNGVIYSKPPDNTVWLEKEDGLFIIHCPGDINTIEGILMLPDGIELIAYSTYKPQEP